MGDVMHMHTPGPWKVYQSDVHPVLEYGGNGNDCYAICECFGPDAFFNQHLIAAAPELLAALQALTDAVDSEDAWSSTLIDDARAAIAKATGGSDD